MSTSNPTTYKKWLVVSFLLSLATMFAGTWAKLSHAKNADTFLFVWMVATIIFVILAILEIMRSNKIPTAEKVMWVLGLIFLNTLTAILYLLLGRKRVMEDAK
jgi:small basic protein